MGAQSCVKISAKTNEALLSYAIFNFFQNFKIPNFGEDWITLKIESGLTQ